MVPIQHATYRRYVRHVGHPLCLPLSEYPPSIPTPSTFSMGILKTHRPSTFTMLLPNRGPPKLSHLGPLIPPLSTQSWTMTQTCSVFAFFPQPVLLRD